MYIDPKKCAECGDCMENCPEDAIVKIFGKVPKLPNRLTKVGKFKRWV
ncbi:4Fe-4S dicluster domain-containing protein [Eubacterium sp.]